MNSKIKKEFFEITHILPLHSTNRLKDMHIRKDNLFNSLGEKIFDNPRLLDLLTIKIKRWLKLEKSETIYSLAGYIYYFKDDFSKAESYFLKAINSNPVNLDNWFDLAFSLYHQGDKKNNIGKEILFNFDYCIKIFKGRNVSTKDLYKTLKNL